MLSNPRLSWVHLSQSKAQRECGAGGDGRWTWVWIRGPGRGCLPCKGGSAENEASPSCCATVSGVTAPPTGNRMPWRSPQPLVLTHPAVFSGMLGSKPAQKKKQVCLYGWVCEWVWVWLPSLLCPRLHEVIQLMSPVQFPCTE